MQLNKTASHDHFDKNSDKKSVLQEIQNVLNIKTADRNIDKYLVYKRQDRVIAISIAHLLFFRVDSFTVIYVHAFIFVILGKCIINVIAQNVTMD